MKTTKSSLMAVIALGCLVAFAPQVKAAAGAGKKAGGHDRMTRMSEELQLTADQKEKLKPIFQAEAQQMKTLRQDTNLPKQDKAAKLKSLRAETSAKVKPILTPEQVEKWNKLQDQAPKKRRKQ